MKAWWCPQGWQPSTVEIDLQVGGGYRIGMKQAGFGAEVSVCGRFLEVRPAQRLRYTWRWEGAFDGMADTLVTIEFIELGGGTN